MRRHRTLVRIIVLCITLLSLCVACNSRQVAVGRKLALAERSCRATPSVRSLSTCDACCKRSDVTFKGLFGQTCACASTDATYAATAR